MLAYLISPRLAAAAAPPATWASSRLAGRAGSALLADVLAGRHGSLSEFLRRAGSLGVDLAGDRLVALVVEPTSLPELARRNALAEEERQRIRLTLAEEIRRAAAERGCAALVGLDGDRALAVMAVDDVKILGDIVTAARRRLGSLTVQAGAGREVTASSLQRSLEEAIEEKIKATGPSKITGVERMVLSVTQERVIFTSYAAVPTAGGWLIIQL